MNEWKKTVETRRTNLFGPIDYISQDIKLYKIKHLLRTKIEIDH